MGCIYRLNSLYEWELESFPEPIELSSNLKIKSNSLEYLFACLQTEEDELYLSHKPELEFVEYLEKKFTKKLQLSSTLVKNKKIVEWGIFHKLKNGILEYEEEIILHHKKISSKMNLAYLREKLFSNIPKRFSISGTSELEKLASKLHFPILLKPEFSLSGVGTYIIKNQNELKTLLFNLEESLNKRRYFIEEWKEKFFDFSALCDAENGLVSLTKMRLDSKGKYQGSEIFQNQDLESSYRKILENLEKNNFLPKGKFSIDGFAYKENGQCFYNYISEINPRWTMGWLLWKLEHMFGKKVELNFIQNKWNVRNIWNIEEQLKINLNKKNLILLSPPFLENKRLSSILVLVF